MGAFLLAALTGCTQELFFGGMDAIQKRQVDSSLTRMGSERNSITNLASTLSISELAALAEPARVATKFGHLAHPHGLGAGIGKLLGDVGTGIIAAEKKIEGAVHAGVDAYKLGAERVGAAAYDEYASLTGRTAPTPILTGSKGNEQEIMTLGKK